ncbi:MAG: hypothetical protein JOY85_07100 [Acidobacteriaceae bacterium]|nr:hypothetical protein [Acidobacteriaceae bacterium]
MLLDAYSFAINPGEEDQWLVELLEQYQDRIRCVYPNLGFSNSGFRWCDEP